MLESNLRPTFEQALASGATAWVCVNDMTALAALDHLSRLNVSVPVALSLASFDNSPGAMTNNLTSYSFNVPALADALLAHVLGGPSRAARRSGGAMEIPGMRVR